MTGHIFLGLMRLESLKRTRLHDSIYSADIVLLAELVLHGEFCELPEPLFYRRVHGESGFNKHTPQGAGLYYGDPTIQRRRLVFPHWQLAFELARSLRCSQLTVYDKLRCLPQVPLWYIRFWRSLAKDLWVAFKQVINPAPQEFRKT
jgi:hypothetical protein